MSTQKVLRKLSLTEKASAATTTTATTLFQIKDPSQLTAYIPKFHIRTPLICTCTPSAVHRIHFLKMQFQLINMFKLFAHSFCGIISTLSQVAVQHFQEDKHYVGYSVTIFNERSHHIMCTVSFE